MTLNESVEPLNQELFGHGCPSTSSKDPGSNPVFSNSVKVLFTAYLENENIVKWGRE